MNLNSKKDLLNKILTYILLVALIISIVLTIYIIIAPKPPIEKFTEFYILGPDGKASNYPTELFVGDEGKVIIGIVNHEYKDTTYYIETWLTSMTHDNSNIQIHNMYLLDTLSITLPSVPIVVDEEWTLQWKKSYTFSIDKPGKWQLWFLLFKDEKPTLPDPIDGDYANTTATLRIKKALDNEIQSLKLNVVVREL